MKSSILLSELNLDLPSLPSIYPHSTFNHNVLFYLFIWVYYLTLGIKPFLRQSAFHKIIICSYPLPMVMVSLQIRLLTDNHVFKIKTIRLSIQVVVVL